MKAEPSPLIAVGPAEAEMTGPLVSVIMSNYNGSAYLAAAVLSVLNQSYSTLELIVVDDASSDDSVAVLQILAASDSRLTIIALSNNLGPAGARNCALEAANGDWIAIMDADDVIHPKRIARLLSAASQLNADMIADDLLSFGSANVAGQTLLGKAAMKAAKRITAVDLVKSDTASLGLASLGYLKPMIHRDALRALRYDETLRIGEDFDLYCRLLIGGATFWVTPEPTYLYRRHSGSVSHRLSAPALENLIAAHDSAATLSKSVGDEGLYAALATRRQRLIRTLHYQHLVVAITTRDTLSACRQLLRRPKLVMDLVASLADRWNRRRHASSDRHISEPRTVVLALPEQISSAEAPEDAVRVPVEAWSPSNESNRYAMACRLTELAAQGPVHIIAIGLEGLDGLGYVPDWNSARIILTAEEAKAASIPSNAMLEILESRDGNSSVRVQ